MTTGEKLFNVLNNARAAAGALPKAKWIALADQFLDVERPVSSPRKKSIVQMTDEEFLASLLSDPTYAGIDVRRELGKCQAWCRTNGKKATRRRFVNWLNKADRTMERFGAGAGERVASIQERATEPPHGWQEFMKEKHREWTQKNGTEYTPPGADALERGDFFGMPKSWREEARAKLTEGAA